MQETFQYAGTVESLRDKLKQGLRDSAVVELKEGKLRVARPSFWNSTVARIEADGKNVAVSVDSSMNAVPIMLGFLMFGIGVLFTGTYAAGKKRGNNERLLADIKAALGVRTNIVSRRWVSMLGGAKLLCSKCRSEVKKEDKACPKCKGVFRKD